jgi:hypothetical protein
VLAGAALALPFSAKATNIVYSGIQDITLDSTSTSGDQTYSLSLDGSALDFSFDASYNNGTDTVTPLMVGSNPLNAYVTSTSGSDDPEALSFGATIGPGQNYSTGAGTLQYSEPFEGTGPPTQKGPWPKDPNTVAYLGVQFYINSDLYYGWVGITACTADFDAVSGSDCGSTTAADSTIVIQDWAYDSTGAAVTAGEGEVPEPSSLALFALGGVGLAALRARRKRAA